MNLGRWGPHALSASGALNFVVVVAAAFPMSLNTLSAFCQYLSSLDQTPWHIWEALGRLTSLRQEGRPSFPPQHDIN